MYDHPFSRRDFVAAFLRGAGCFAVAGCAPFRPRLTQGSEPAGRYAFPQGLASGDPTDSSVVLWTRVVPTDGSGALVRLVAQVSRMPDFADLIAERVVAASAATDHTVRLIVHELEPDTTYYYRFVAGSDVAPVPGRTRTAPRPDADRPVRLAFASCQAYEAGYHSAWRTMITEDEARPEDERIHFVLHLGDYIYEALGYGRVRRVDPFPSGGAPLGEGVDWARTYAVTVDDYRHLYRTYLADPDLQAARARWPFVVTWDDHEFSDDSWQSASTFGVEPRPDQERKLAANQAWFEYIPAFLTGTRGVEGVAPRAHDFRSAAVETTPFGPPDEKGFRQDPSNQAAVGSLTIYRSLRWGRNVELVVTDTRSYRSEHPVPGRLNVEISGTTRYISPLALVRTLDAGREANGGRPPAALPIGDRQIPNPRRALPPGTMLGAEQKEWWKRTMAGADATWKLWATSVPLMPTRFDLSAIDPAAADAVMTIDTWDGYPHERAELLGWLAERGVLDVVSLAGDNHHSFAGVLAAEFDAEAPRWFGAEFAVCGISSTPLFRAFASAVEAESPLRPLVTFDSRPFGGADAEVEALNMTFLYGARASVVAARTGSVEQARAARNPRHNRHLRYCDTNAHGYGVARVTAEQVEAELVTIAPPHAATNAAGAPVVRRARFGLPVSRGREGARLQGPAIEGEPPFPFPAGDGTAQDPSPEAR
jgi:alkaline phosphatase D